MWNMYFQVAMLEVQMIWTLMKSFVTITIQKKSNYKHKAEGQDACQATSRTAAYYCQDIIIIRVWHIKVSKFKSNLTKFKASLLELDKTEKRIWRRAPLNICFDIKGWTDS